MVKEAAGIALLEAGRASTRRKIFTSMEAETLIPEQTHGGEKHSHEERSGVTEAGAQQIFVRAVARLRNANAWKDLTQGPSAHFALCDAHGNPVQRSAQEKDLLRIELPGPRRASASGFDYACLETVREGSDEKGPWFVLTTRPAPDPTAPDQGAAHFFSAASTGTFVVRKQGLRVTVDHYDRNIAANTEDGKLLDKARALLVSAGAALGFSDLQWSKLSKGLLDDDPGSE